MEFFGVYSPFFILRADSVPSESLSFVKNVLLEMRNFNVTDIKLWWSWEQSSAKDYVHISILASMRI
jgi:hypothetical protein